MGCFEEARLLPTSLCDKVFLSEEQLSVRRWLVGAVVPAGHLPAWTSLRSLDGNLGNTKASPRCCSQRGADRCGWRALCPGRGSRGLMGRRSPSPGGRSLRQGLLHRTRPCQEPHNVPSPSLPQTPPLPLAPNRRRHSVPHRRERPSPPAKSRLPARLCVRPPPQPPRGWFSLTPAPS